MFVILWVYEQSRICFHDKLYLLLVFKQCVHKIKTDFDFHSSSSVRDLPELIVTSPCPGPRRPSPVT